jgi:GDPmannose 4,6-dehydratase
MNIALITGITGMDGSYLAELLLEKNYKVHGIIRRCSNINTQRIEHLRNNVNLKLHYGDLTDGTSLYSILNKIKNTYDNFKYIEIYNLGAQSHVAISFEVPEFTASVDAFGTLKLLEAIKACELCNRVKMYNACTSELFGKVQSIPQNENTPFYPRSPYGVAKLYSYWIVKNYRESYGMFLCNGILFNHTGPRRGHNFVERKITIGLGKILRGEEDKLVLGNINSLRDWGYAKDYVYGMYLMMQQEKADDYVLATGEMHTVREFVEIAFSLRGFNIKWKGEKENEIGYDENTGRELIFIDKKFYRPAEVDLLLGDATKSKNILGWNRSVEFLDLVKMMVNNDC